jgi:hypothetical protein
VKYTDQREYTLDFLKVVQKKLLNNMRRIIEDTNPYNLLHEELVREFFDSMHTAKRFERSQNISSLTLGTSGANQTLLLFDHSARGGNHHQIDMSLTTNTELKHYSGKHYSV